MKDYKICQGIVEDISDPLKLGRVRVRLFHYHSEKKEIGGERGIPTEDLPWAIPCIPVTDSLISGIGKSSVGLKNGTEVLVLSRDKLMQDLLVISSIPGIFQEPAKPNEGFYDPDGKYPIEDRLLEPDTNRLMRNEKINETYIKDVADRTLSNIPIGFAGTWSEPKPVDYFKPEYPYNKVTETESGHIFEVDDTPGYERISTWHKSGAFDLITNKGERLIKLPSNFYLTVEEGSVCVYAKEGSILLTSKEDVVIKAEGAIGLESKLGIKIQSEADIDIDAVGSINIDGKEIRTNN